MTQINGDTPFVKAQWAALAEERRQETIAKKAKQAAPTTIPIGQANPAAKTDNIAFNSVMDGLNANKLFNPSLPISAESQNKQSGATSIAAALVGFLGGNSNLLKTGEPKRVGDVEYAVAIGAAYSWGEGKGRPPIVLVDALAGNEKVIQKKEQNIDGVKSLIESTTKNATSRGYYTPEDTVKLFTWTGLLNKYAGQEVAKQNITPENLKQEKESLEKAKTLPGADTYGIFAKEQKLRDKEALLRLQNSSQYANQQLSKSMTSKKPETEEGSDYAVVGAGNYNKTNVNNPHPADAKKYNNIQKIEASGVLALGYEEKVDGKGKGRIEVVSNPNAQTPQEAPTTQKEIKRGLNHEQGAYQITRGNLQDVLNVLKKGEHKNDYKDLTLKQLEVLNDQYKGGASIPDGTVLSLREKPAQNTSGVNLGATPQQAAKSDAEIKFGVNAEQGIYKIKRGNLQDVLNVIQKGEHKNDYKDLTLKQLEGLNEQYNAGKSIPYGKELNIPATGKAQAASGAQQSKVSNKFTEKGLDKVLVLEMAGEGTRKVAEGSNVLIAKHPKGTHNIAVVVAEEHMADAAKQIGEQPVNIKDMDLSNMSRYRVKGIMAANDISTSTAQSNGAISTDNKGRSVAMHIGSAQMNQNGDTAAVGVGAAVKTMIGDKKKTTPAPIPPKEEPEVPPVKPEEPEVPPVKPEEPEVPPVKPEEPEVPPVKPEEPEVPPVKPEDKPNPTPPVGPTPGEPGGDKPTPPVKPEDKPNPTPPVGPTPGEPGGDRPTPPVKPPTEGPDPNPPKPPVTPEPGGGQETPGTGGDQGPGVKPPGEQQPGDPGAGQETPGNGGSQTAPGTGGSQTTPDMGEGRPTPSGSESTKTETISEVMIPKTKSLNLLS